MIIVGAGPTGLMLAGELGLAGVRPLVLEQQPQIRDIPKAGGLSGQILELLRYRGELERFEAARTAPSPALRLPFGGVHVDFTHLADPPLELLMLHNGNSSACSANSPASSAPGSAADMRWLG